MNDKFSKLISIVITLSLLGIAGWFAVGYALRFPLVASPPILRNQTQPTKVAMLLSTSSTFGTAPVEPPKDRMQQASKGNYSLIGLIAGSNSQSGVALLKKEGDNSTLAVKIGKEVEPGLKLSYVSKNEIELGGARLSLPSLINNHANNSVNPGQNLVNSTPVNAYTPSANHSMDIRSRDQGGRPSFQPVQRPEASNYSPPGGMMPPSSLDHNSPGQFSGASGASSPL